MENNSKKLNKRKTILTKTITEKRSRDIIIKEYKKLYETSIDEGFIKYHKFKELKNLLKEMVEENNFFLCRKCSIIFYNKNEEVQHHFKLKHIDQSFLHDIRKKMVRIKKTKEKAKAGQIRPGIDDTFTITKISQDITCFPNHLNEKKTKNDQDKFQLEEEEEEKIITPEEKKEKKQQRKLAEQFYYEMSIPNSSECENTESSEEKIN